MEGNGEQQRREAQRAVLEDMKEKRGSRKGPSLDWDWAGRSSLLPAQLEGELELARVVGRCRLARSTGRAG